jgi:hypothetical protein
VCQLGCLLYVRYSKLKANKLDIFKIIIAFAVAIPFFKMGWEDVQLNNQFQKYGIKTQATLAGYQYRKSQRGWSGSYYPLLSYTTQNNVKFTHVANEYEITKEFQKKELAKEEIYITYLPSNPSKAVVYQWIKPDYQYAGYFWGSLFLIIGFAGLFQQLYLTRYSSQKPNSTP